MALAIVAGLAIFAGPTPVTHGVLLLTVNSTADTTDGSCDAPSDCTLREAIIAANAATTLDTIEFSIAGVGPHTISPGGALPTITDPVIIDGTSEPDYAPGVPVVVLDGSGAGISSNGLEISGGGATVKGLVIHSFDTAGVMLSSGGGNTITLNFIGTNAAGVAPLPNDIGVFLDGSSSNTVGPDNLISGNAVYGVEILEATSNVVTENIIGSNLAGDAFIPNGGPAGVSIVEASSNTVGPGNLISGNGGDGVLILPFFATGNTIQGNSIHSNAGLGINNLDGGNTELTPPAVTAAAPASGTSDCAGCTIELFSDSVDEGKDFHGSTTTAAGPCPCAWSLASTLTGPNLTATVTDGSGNTSEFSAPFVIPDSDGDGLADNLDACPATFTAWPTPLGDDDCDGFSAAAETGIGTDPNVACALTAATDDEADDRWPPDFDDSQAINTVDVFQVLPPHFGSTVPPTSVRRDLDPSGAINTVDVFKVLPPFYGSSCTP